MSLANAWMMLPSPRLGRRRIHSGPDSFAGRPPNGSPPGRRVRPRPASRPCTVPEARRRRLGVADDEVLAGLVTSGDWVKRGVATFIEALGAVRGSLPRLHGVVTGKERSMKRYAVLAKQHGVADQLHFLPPSDALDHVYGALDVFVYPAQFEEFGMCVQEAMACALPVVCGRRVGATELLDPAASK